MFIFFVLQVAGFVKGLPGCKEHAATFKTEVSTSGWFVKRSESESKSHMACTLKLLKDRCLCNRSASRQSAHFIFKVEPPLTGRLRPFTSFVTLLAG